MVDKSPIDQLPEGFPDDVNEGDRTVVLSHTQVFICLRNEDCYAFLKVAGIVSSREAVVKDLSDNHYQGLREVIRVHTPNGVRTWCFVLERFKDISYVHRLKWTD